MSRKIPAEFHGNLSWRAPVPSIDSWKDCSVAVLSAAAEVESSENTQPTIVVEITVAASVFNGDSIYSVQLHTSCDVSSLIVIFK